MTKTEYIAWKALRETQEHWNRDDCREADQLIKATAIENFIKHTRQSPDKNVAEFTIDMVRFHYGSAEVDALLTATGCYPDWM